MPFSFAFAWLNALHTVRHSHMDHPDARRSAASPGGQHGTGAQEGYLGLTNKENAAGSKCSNFLINKKIVRPEFEPKKEKTMREKTATAAAVAAEDEPVRKDGHPSDHCQKLLPKLILAQPKDFVDMQLTPDFWSWTVDATKYHAWLMAQ